MAKRSDISRDDRIGIDELEVIEEKIEEEKYNEFLEVEKKEIDQIIETLEDEQGNETKEEKLTVSKEPDRVWIRLNYPSNVKMAGQSGERYVFPGISSEVKVRAEDVEQLLAIRRGGCCGAVPSFMFELVK